MFKVKDIVIYTTEGLCKITEICSQDFNGHSTDYYVLKPMLSNRPTIFVPVDNEQLVERIRPVLSADEVHKLIKAMPDQETIWIENSNDRKKRYKEILSDSDHLELVSLIKTLYFYQEELQDSGKKLHLADKMFMEEAEKILYEEFAYVLDIEPSQLIPLIVGVIEADE
ncbi:CarD family transcriptional regulator [Culicoidibacter larvae]|uniref:CarD family transcriptional regulator n=1 Tax=Culicoidibacter larvae TaxID=2579976 RepID=A0A5R8Q8U4_9FIRM|nr:CarD family transcriptional regulator [Culicoidibacter larvae]TLG72134.1 CarD family transcriptional regulator [Culicoidibacter larvae]